MMIEVTDLTKVFGSFTAVNRVSFRVKKGEIFGFLGANGAGKTTVIQMLCGLLLPTSGTAKIVGFDVTKEVEKVKLNIGYMSQKFSLYNDLTVEENIDFYGGIYRLSRKELQAKKDELYRKNNLNKIKKYLVKEIPLGWKQRLALSVSLLHNPKIVFLDEPTGGVDPLTRKQFWNLIYETASSGTTIFVTTHYMDEAEYCDRISIMVEGDIKALDTPENLKKIYNVNSINDLFIKVSRSDE